MDKLKLLAERYKSNIGFEVKDLNKLLKSATDRKPSNDNFKNINEVYWLKQYFIDGEIERAKQYLYVFGVLSNFVINKRKKLRSRVDRWNTNTYMIVGPTMEIL